MIPLSTDDLGWFFAGFARGASRPGCGRRRPTWRPPSCAADEPARDRAAVAALARHGLFALAAPATGATSARALCLTRELLGYVSPRADSIFAVQGLGAHAVAAAAGTAAQRAALPDLAAGLRVAAFALTEPEAGSDVAAIATRAVADGDGWRLSGEKCFISNLGVADVATVVATVDPAAGRRGLTAFWLPLDTPGVTVVAQEPIAPHPLGRLILDGARLGADAVIGQPGDGFPLAMATLDTFRVSVAAAAVGMARRALAEAVGHVRTRVQFGKPLAEQPLVQAHLADMATQIDAARLLALRAAYLRDAGADRTTVEVSMAKLHATEAAQDVIDRAVQLLGGRGVMRGAVVEHLYRAIRPLRIYEGTSADPAHDHRARRRPQGGRVVTVAPPAPEVRFPDDLSLADYWLYDRVAEGRGGHVAIRLGDRAWTYAQVAQRSHALARALQGFGLEPGDRVYIVLPDLPPFAWAIFATLTAGGVVTMGNPVAPAADLARVVEYVGARVLVTTPAVADAIVPHLGRGSRLIQILLVPDAGIDDDPEVTVEAGPVLGGSGRSWTSLDRAIHRGEPSAAGPAAHPPRRRGDLAVHLGLDRRPQGGDALPPRLRVQHRGLRQGHDGLPRRRRHGQRAAAVLRLRHRHQPVVPVRGGGDRVPVPGATDAREPGRGDRPLPADHRHQRPDDAGQAARSRRRAAGSRPGRPRSVVRALPPVGGRGPAAGPARALPRPLRRGGLRRHRLGRDVPHLLHQPPRRRGAGLARARGAGLASWRSCRRRRAAPARRRCRPARSASCG
ncbi:MAG: acyl-CoA dehydrogenase family protein [Kofleriaceae bacterium]|nr:acyl-CoA dehydrogenase family protein [Kofleriaceae bacterium]